jgi:hypothetical protein
MAAVGYIYILSNPSMPGLHKIGKTQRPPGVRAQELSESTGVPINFVLEFEVAVSDCDAAEREIHARMATLRISPDREFFRIALHEAVRVVSEVAAAYTPEGGDVPSSGIGRLELLDIARSVVLSRHDIIPQMYRERAVEKLHAVLVQRARNDSTAVALANEVLPGIVAALMGMGNRNVKSSSRGTRYTYLLNL